MAAAGDGRDGDRARAEPLPRPANPTPAPEPEAPPARPPGRVLDYHELPSALQRSMPKLVVTGHSISEEDNVRLVVINDRVLREGEQVAPDLRLEAIGADGVVLNYRGYRFRPAP
jgi:general secretion pathway protein B